MTLSGVEALLGKVSFGALLAATGIFDYKVRPATIDDRGTDRGTRHRARESARESAREPLPPPPLRQRASPEPPTLSIYPCRLPKLERAVEPLE